jgi:hypothetical protein
VLDQRSAPRREPDPSAKGHWRSAARRRLRALLILLGIGVTVGLAGATILLLKPNPIFGHKTLSAVGAYLDDLRDGRYDRAYDRLCGDSPIAGTRESFLDRARAAEARNVTVTAWKLRALPDRETLAFRLAEGTVSFSDGSVRPASFSSSERPGQDCIYPDSELPPLAG